MTDPSSIKLLILSVLSALYINIGNSQNCQPPLVSKFESHGIGEVEVFWINTNTPPASSFDIQYVVKGQSNIITVENQVGISLLMSNLQNGQDYELYIRAHCSATLSSVWNGPFSFRTDIDNAQACGTHLQLEDNSCPDSESIIINVDGLVGTEIFKSIYFIIFF